MAGPLSDALLLRVDDDSRTALEGISGLEAALSEIAGEAAAQWPGVELADEVFVAYLADRLEPGATIDSIRAVRAPDLYLAAACALGVAGSVERLQQTFDPEIAKAIGHMDRRSTFVADVTQALWVKLLTSDLDRLPKIADFAGKSRLWRWLRVIATRLAIDMAGPERFAGRLADGQLPDETGDIELDHLRRHYAAEFREAFEQAVGALDTDQRLLLKLHLVDRLTIDQLGTLRSVHRATAARQLRAARDQLAKLTLDRMRRKLGVDSGELESIMRLIRSRLDASVARLLQQ